MKHTLKIWPKYFHRVKEGSKTFEVRVNDRDFQQGDTVVLKEWDPEIPETSGFGYRAEPRGYTGEQLEFKIGYILDLGRWSGPVESGQEHDFRQVAFSLLPVEHT